MYIYQSSLSKVENLVSYVESIYLTALNPYLYVHSFH